MLRHARMPAYVLEITDLISWDARSWTIVQKWSVDDDQISITMIRHGNADNPRGSGCTLTVRRDREFAVTRSSDRPWAVETHATHTTHDTRTSSASATI